MEMAIYQVFNAKVTPDPFCLMLKPLDAAMDPFLIRENQYFFQNGILELSESFSKASLEYFKNLEEEGFYEKSDRYFSNLIGNAHNTLARRGQFAEAKTLLYKVLEFAHELETKMQHDLHLGTPYYFLGEVSFLQGDIDGGLLAMSASLAQDRIHAYDEKLLPARSFLTFDDNNPNQHFKPYVDMVAEVVRGKFSAYARAVEDYIEEPLSYEKFRAVFLENPLVDDSMWLIFLFGLMTLEKMNTAQVYYPSEQIAAPLVFSDASLRITTLIDFYTFKYMPEEADVDKDKFRDRIFSICRRLRLYDYETPEAFSADLRIRSNRDDNFQSWLEQLISCTYTTQAGRTINKLESDIVIALGLRNFSAHKIESEQAIWHHNNKVTEAIMNVLFLVIDLYPPIVLGH